MTVPIHRFCYLLIVALSAPSASSAGLIVNGDFELGNLNGWTVVTQTGSGNFFAESMVAAPLSGLPTVGPSSGAWYAVSDQNPPGDAYALLQSFTIPLAATQVLLNYDLFVNDASGVGPLDAGGLDFTLANNQHARVDILTSGAAGLSTSGGDVVANFYLGVDPFATNPNPYTINSFDITGIVTPGSTYQLRFAGVNNIAPLNMGLDNIDIVVASAAVPEPSSLVILASGVAWFGVRRMRTVKIALSV